MIQPLNYTPKAIVDLLRQADRHDPLDRKGLLYIVGKLRQAQAFMLPDFGQLLDRGKPSVLIPELALTPPFPVTALEYAAPAARGAAQGEWTAVASSRRIALAWRWEDDYPYPEIRQGLPALGPGVAIASICYLDAQQAWAIMPGVGHISYDAAYVEPSPGLSAFQRSAIEHGRVTKAQIAQERLSATPLALFPIICAQSIRMYGHEAFQESLTADLLDELNAYRDLCTALACRNVQTEVRPAPAALNKERAKKGKPLLLDTHVLKLSDTLMGGAGERESARGSIRQHVRRGHIRRLSADRLTWVNQTMVGAGRFVDKVYAL